MYACSQFLDLLPWCTTQTVW